MADQCVALLDAARTLLRELRTDHGIETRALAEIAANAGWSWGPAVLAALPSAKNIPRYVEATAFASFADEQSGFGRGRGATRPRKTKGGKSRAHV